MKHSPGFLAIVQDALSRVTEISADEYKELRESGIAHTLLDVREESEWRAGHAEGAAHLGKGVIERDIETQYPDTGAILILYCGGGYRSALAADALQKMGYTQVRSLSGGWRAWQEAKLPVSAE